MRQCRRRRSNLGWSTDPVPSDFTARVMALHEARDCGEASAIISDGKRILRQLKSRGRLPNENTMARWYRSLKAFKKSCPVRRRK